ncbi:MAG: hypothetical protein FGO69_11265 [Methanobacterium sp.]|nr:MAG: hypothetical protein FGO69_11265 [Methanobacterium sp.]
MDDKGFIFTADAVLGLIIVFILTTSIVTYAMLPIYEGQDHQHLEALADSALETMEASGTLRSATVDYYSNNPSQAESDLRTSLNMLIPYGIGYKLTVGDNPPVTDNRGLVTATDVVTKVKVISGPEEGWMGRAYYKIENVSFTTVNQTTTTTVWNFHNYLNNFQPWNGNGFLSTHPYWAGSNAASPSQIPQPISFSIPTIGTINGVQFLFGSTYDGTATGNRATNTSLFINGVLRETIDPNEFLYIYSYGSGSSTRKFYNNKTNLSTSLFHSGENNFYLRFNTASSTNRMPWFSILANYTTTLNVAEGILFNNSKFNDIAGVGRPQGSNSILFNLDTGTTSNVPGRTINWNTLQTSDIDVSTPFQLEGIPGRDSNTPGSAVASTTNIYVPPGTRLFDAYVVVNAYAAVDGAIVQVKPEGGTWQTVFTSFGGYTQRTDGGYGNLPGIISLHDSYDTSKDYLRAGNNTVRIIIWDDSPGRDDNDLVGLENCYASITYSSLPIKWDTTTFDSYQSTGNTLTQSKPFTIESGAENVYLFMGVGLDTRSVRVRVNNSEIYNGPPQYALNLEEYDTNNIFSTVVNGKRVLKPGDYSLEIRVTPAIAYESGDYGGSTTSAPITYGNYANPEIFSGTRIGVLYPQFLANMWSVSFSSDPDVAKSEARERLIQNVTAQGFRVNESLIKLEALYSGDVPNAVPVRLELWKK